MLTPLQVGQFRAMGFLNIEGCLSPADVERFEAAYDRLLAEAEPYDYFEDNIGEPSRGTLHHGTAESDDGFAPFIEHDNIVAAQRDIFGRPCLFQGGSVWLNISDTPWHSDVLGSVDRDPDFFQIKMAIYLDELDADSGSLNVIPGSHFPEFGQALLADCGYKEGGVRPRLHLESPPGAVSVVSRPGDVVLFDTRVWHSAFHREGGRRTAFLQYVPDPGDSPQQQQQVRECFKSNPFTDHLIETAGPLRKQMVSRLHELGIA